MTSRRHGLAAIHLRRAARAVTVAWMVGSLPAALTVRTLDRLADRQRDLACTAAAAHMDRVLATPQGAAQFLAWLREEAL